jgi:preprotein translocase subunit SecG
MSFPNWFWWIIAVVIILIVIVLLRVDISLGAGGFHITQGLVR